MTSIARISTVAALLVASGCEGPTGPQGETGTADISAAQVSYTPVAGSLITSANVQDAIDQITEGYLPLTGGTAQSLTVSNRLAVAGQIDGALARARIVLVRCETTTPTCNGTACPAGASCPGFGTVDAMAKCPTGFLATGGGCQNTDVAQGNDYCGPATGTYDTWHASSITGSASRAHVVCLSTQ